MYLLSQQQHSKPRRVLCSTSTTHQDHIRPVPFPPFLTHHGLRNLDRLRLLLHPKHIAKYRFLTILPQPPSPILTPQQERHILDAYQSQILTAYKALDDEVAKLMRKVVELQVHISQHRDSDPKIEEVEDKLLKKQGKLDETRGSRAAKEQQIEAEKKRLREVGTMEAATQLRELGERLGEDRKTIVLLH
ncbi:hypothetical protein N0V83_006735 [Neocucurbitaria cava]|uniref:Uncharacterized protein n=1 Tax=Neocucurbitaria cava TaxID=798079 RepID=A0A9W8Y6I2_9PLEO|nr:hypothetical protein N0V83_006735 [Neocucurbitaria cava]